ncbi:MAG: glycogen synthase [Solirubrobacteraceae bacterium]|jgi:glycosyltransferase involved in cell wall biosynthesis|nr:glycogen synthase [Solirubrobacteraceae bacterium]
MAPPERPRFALVSREVYPFGGGGIGFYVSSTARLLAEIGEVKVFTTSRHRARYEELSAAGDPRLPVEDVEIVFVPEVEPDEVGGFYSVMHAYSAAVLDALRRTYGDRGPDLIEFSDYLGEGAVTVQARRAGDPLLSETKVAVRLHTSAEMCAVLDGSLGQDFESRSTCALERLALREADVVVWQGGDTLASYRRFYGAGELAPAHHIRYPYARAGEAAAAGPEEPRDPSGPLRLVYLGRLERRKGVQTLVAAVTSIDSNLLQVTLVGGDTDTAPLGTSMASNLELMSGDDPRIDFVPSLTLEDLRAVVLASDAVVLPSLWEAWPYVALEALQANRPIIATPVGGFAELVQPGVSGWVTADTGPESLASTIERLLFDRREVERLRLEGLPARTFAELVEPGAVAAGYRALVEAPGRWPAGAPRVGRRPPGPRVAAARAPVVSVVIPYHRLAEHVAETVASAFAQTHRSIEVILVNDGSFGEEDWILAELAAEYPLAVLSQANAGLGAARNFGIGQSRGRYILPLDADNVLGPTFVARTLEILEAEPSVAFVTSWSRYIDKDGEPLEHPGIGFQPIGNRTTMIETENVAGDAVALIRRWLFDIGFDYSQDLTSYEDWDLYCRLARAGHFGLVIPERLFDYRVRENSMIRQLGIPNTARLREEMAAGMREREVRWEYRSD